MVGQWEESRTNKARLFCGRGYSYLGHDRNTQGSEMLENMYLEYIEDWHQLIIKLNIYHFEPPNFGGHPKQLAKNPEKLLFQS